MIDKKLFLDILQSREDRAQKQIDLIKDYPYSLISFTLNIPGIIKDNELYRKIHDEGFKQIVKSIKDNSLEIKYKEYISKSTGSEGYISVDVQAEELKRIMVSLEINHPLGRIFDIDVFDKNHNQMSRSDLGLKVRKCLLCNKDARLCMREKNHTYEELISRIEELSKEYFTQY
ncbi:citrate lyase holo-[acyl-carrier protein] synthase [Tissierella sp. Yu-01]|uniref:citrate lyase holo-[acyl-carrier protein] synthase n=1 Tax=Tissierella sp. Yu-01 TaxID=3035694 RepID=UPI00240DDDDF|nr:citrate lyase holo-[acyl-carrier protein] synthase [Tissierella sp. Yu-01]WFA08127.1 citrate lyase holo-[acyl-carrier protein] synthase [Tissierella sp. Yu-01]